MYKISNNKNNSIIISLVILL